MEVLIAVLVFILFSCAIGQIAKKAGEKPGVRDTAGELFKRLLK